jgi:hypothetical protein
MIDVAIATGLIRALVKIGLEIMEDNDKRKKEEEDGKANVDRQDHTR